MSPHHDAVNRFLTMAWRRQAQFGTLLHLVFSGLPEQTALRSSVAVVWAAGWAAVVSQTLSVRSRIFVDLQSPDPATPPIRRSPKSHGHQSDGSSSAWNTIRNA